MFLGVNTRRRASWDSNSENKRVASWENKSFPPTQCQDLLPNSASILLCSSGVVLRSGCAMGMQKTCGHQLLKMMELLLLGTIGMLKSFGLSGVQFLPHHKKIVTLFHSAEGLRDLIHV